MSSGDGDEAKGDEAGLVNVFQPLQRGTNKVAPGPSSDDGDRYYGMTPAAARQDLHKLSLEKSLKRGAHGALAVAAMSSAVEKRRNGGHPRQSAQGRIDQSHAMMGLATDAFPVAGEPADQSTTDGPRASADDQPAMKRSAIWRRARMLKHAVRIPQRSSATETYLPTWKTRAKRAVRWFPFLSRVLASASAGIISAYDSFEELERADMRRMSMLALSRDSNLVFGHQIFSNPRNIINTVIPSLIVAPPMLFAAAAFATSASLARSGMLDDWEARSPPRANLTTATSAATAATAALSAVRDYDASALTGASVLISFLIAFYLGYCYNRYYTSNAWTAGITSWSAARSPASTSMIANRSGRSGGTSTSRTWLRWWDCLRATRWTICSLAL